MNINQKAPGTAKKYWRYIKLWGVVSGIIFCLYFVTMVYLSSNGHEQTADTMRGYMVLCLILLSAPAAYFRRKMGGDYTRGTEDDAVREESFSEIRDSGPLIESYSTLGYIGHLADTLTVDVYPAGLVARGSRLRKKPVRAEEVIQISYQVGENESGLEIKHNAPAVDSPIFLRGVGLDSPIGVALTNVAGPFKVKWPQPI